MRQLHPVSIVVGLILGLIAGWYFTGSAWERDAVANKAGHYVFYDDGKGRVTRQFSWTENLW